MKFFYLLVTLILTPLIVGASEDSTIKDLGSYKVPHPGGNLEYKMTFTFAGESGMFLLHRCLEGRETVSLQGVPKNPKKKTQVWYMLGLRNDDGSSIACEQENWFVFGAHRFEDFKGGAAIHQEDIRLFCVNGNLIRVNNLRGMENLGVSKGSNRCSLE